MQTLSQIGVLAELHLTENLFPPQLQLLVTRHSQRLQGPGWHGSRHLCLHSRFEVVSCQKVADMASGREQRSPQEWGSWRRWAGFESSEWLASGLVFLPQKQVYL